MDFKYEYFFESINILLIFCQCFGIIPLCYCKKSHKFTLNKYYYFYAIFLYTLIICGITKYFIVIYTHVIKNFKSNTSLVNLILQTICEILPFLIICKISIFQRCKQLKYINVLLKINCYENRKSENLFKWSLVEIFIVIVCCLLIQLISFIHVTDQVLVNTLYSILVLQTVISSLFTIFLINIFKFLYLKFKIINQYLCNDKFFTINDIRFNIKLTLYFICIINKTNRFCGFYILINYLCTFLLITSRLYVYYDSVINQNYYYFGTWTFIVNFLWLLPYFTLYFIPIIYCHLITQQVIYLY